MSGAAGRCMWWNRVRFAAAVLAFLLAAPAAAHDAAPRVACLGDSNTRGTIDPPFGWCAILESRYGLTTRNFGVGGATALPNDLEAFLGPLSDGGWFARTQLDAALAWGADWIVFAFVTNDALFSGTEVLFHAIATDEAPDELVALVGALEAPGRGDRWDDDGWEDDDGWGLDDDDDGRGRSAIVLMGPPILDPFLEDANPDIEAINAELEARVPDAFLADSLDFRPADFQPDGVHLSASGHRKRAERVAVRILPEPPVWLLRASALLALARLAARGRAWRGRRDSNPQLPA